MRKSETVVKVKERPLTPGELAALENEGKVYKPPVIAPVDSDTIHAGNSPKALTFENAFKYSEFIGICTYEGYDKDTNITFYHTPVAHFHIDTILKGPKLNRALPIRFEFHDRSDHPTKQADWKFSPDKMPAVGSHWLIFTNEAIPTNGGAFETYR